MEIAQAEKDYLDELKAATNAGVPLADAEAALAARKPPDTEPFELWPENEEAFVIFCALQTQWHLVSGAARTARAGLMYSEATSYMRERGLRRARRLELLEDLRVMERSALETWSKAASG